MSEEVIVPGEEIDETGKRRARDPELAAMEKIVRIFEDFESPEIQSRVMDWFQRRYGVRT